MSNNRKDTTANISQSIMADLEKYMTENNLRKGESIEKAVAEYLYADDLGSVEDSLITQRNDLINIVASLQSDADSDSFNSDFSVRTGNNYYSEPSDARGTERFSIDADLLNLVGEEVSKHPDWTYKRDVYERAIWLMTRTDREERLQELQSQIDELLRYISSCIDDARGKNGYVSVLSSDQADARAEAIKTGESPEPIEIDDDQELNPSLEECRSAGRPFTTDELRTVARYAKDFPKDFELHPSRVDQENVIERRWMVLGLAYGLVSHEEVAGHDTDIVPREAVETAIRKAAPDGVTEHTMFEKYGDPGSYMDEFVADYLYDRYLISSITGEFKVMYDLTLDEYRDNLDGWTMYENPLQAVVFTYDEIDDGEDVDEFFTPSNGVIPMNEWMKVRLGLRNIDAYLKEVDDEELALMRARMVKKIQTLLRKRGRWMVAEELGIPMDERYDWESEKGSTVGEMERRKEKARDQSNYIFSW